MKDEDREDTISHGDLLSEIEANKKALVDHATNNTADHNRIVNFLEKLGGRLWGVVGMILVFGLGILGAVWQMYTWTVERHEKLLHGVGAMMQ